MARTKALQNVGVTYDGDNLQSHLNTGSLNATVEAIESTTFASSAMEQGPGAPSFSVDIGVYTLTISGTVETYVRVTIDDLGGATNITAALVLCVADVTM